MVNIGDFGIGLQNLLMQKSIIILIVVITLLIFTLIVIWITFAITNSKLKGKLLIDNPLKLDIVSSPTNINASDLPKCNVGREYTFSFWIYLEEFSQTTGTNPYKLIFYRGDTGSIKSANPIVFMDPIQNKLYFAIKTQSSVIPDADPQTPGTKTDKISDQLSRVISSNYFQNSKLSIDTNKTVPSPNLHIILAVDYVPLQRWANFQLVINNKLLTVYMDGNVYSVKGTDEIKSLRQPEFDTLNAPFNYNLIIDKTTGDLSLGPVNFNSTTINGYISKLEFFNYAISINQSRSIYSSGPFTNNLLSRFGITNNYAIRNPIYKKNATTNK